jgi:hypothetical protein
LEALTLFYRRSDSIDDAEYQPTVVVQYNEEGN